MTQIRLMHVLTGVFLVIGILSTQALAEPTVLRVMTNGSTEYIENTRAFFREFERRNPDIRIQIEIGYLDKFLVLYAAGDPPDLLRLWGEYVPEYAVRGLLQSLEPFLQSSELISKDDLIPVAMDSLSYNGQLYSIPWGLSVTSLFVNVNHYQEAGLSVPDASWSWEDQALDAARRLTRDVDGDGKTDRFFINYGLRTNNYAFVNMAGGNLFDNQSWAYEADSAAAIEGLGFQYNLISQYGVMPGPATVSRTADWELLRGNTSSNLEGSWYVSSLLFTDVPFEWDLALIPSYKGARGTSLWPETPWGIPTGVSNPELSWRLMEFIGSTEGQALATQLGLAMPPIRLDVAQTVFLDAYPNQGVLSITEMAVAPNTRTIPTAPEQARRALDAAIRTIMTGQVAARQAMEGVRPQVEAVVREFFTSLGD